MDPFRQGFDQISTVQLCKDPLNLIISRSWLPKPHVLRHRAVEQKILLQHDPHLAIALLQRALQRLRLATQTTCLALFSDAYSRLSALLQRQQIPVQNMDPAPAPMTHAQMAQHIGCSREMVSRIMKELVQGGYVVREPDKIYRVCRRLPMRW
jgi:CRP-like cAMP-binding protein